MGFFNEYPYTNLHELNLDWIIENFKSILDKLNKHDLDIEKLFKEMNLSKDDIKNLYKLIISIGASISFFNSVDEMKKFDLGKGVVAFTKNFYEDINGGGAIYFIESKNNVSANGYDKISLENGNVAILIVPWTVRRLGGKENTDITDLWRYMMTNMDRSEDINCEHGTYLSRYMMIYGHDRVVDFHGSTIKQIVDLDEYHNGIILNLTTAEEYRKNIYIKNLNLDLTNMVYETGIGSRPFNINAQDNGMVSNIHYENINIYSNSNNLNHVFFINADNGKNNIKNIYLENINIDKAGNGAIFINKMTDIHINNANIKSSENVVNQTISGSDCDLIEIDNCIFETDAAITGGGACIHANNSSIIINDSTLKSNGIYSVIKSDAGKMMLNNAIVSSLNQGIRIDGNSDIECFVSNCSVKSEFAIFVNKDIAPFICVASTKLDGYIECPNSCKIYGVDSKKRRNVTLPKNGSQNVPLDIVGNNIDVIENSAIIPYDTYRISGTITNSTGLPRTLRMIDTDTNEILYQVILLSSSACFDYVVNGHNKVKFVFSNGDYTSALPSTLYIEPLI